MENTNTQEMFILSKYKYIRYLAKSAEKVVIQTTKQVVQTHLPKAQMSEEINKAGLDAKQAELDAKEKKKAEKESLNTLEFPTCKYYKIGNIYFSILNYHQKLF